ncbi:MAG: glycerophosphodiester phosphodiesterase family protein [Pseudomonadota bacterium]
MRRKYLLLALPIVGLVWAVNASLFVVDHGGAPKLLAHRGVHQQFASDRLDADTCTAAIMAPPSHSFLENTLPSMAAAFAAGADVIEIDVHLTPDREFIVFHDWRLDCRTEGQGVTNETRLPALKSLDVGYGYTADGGGTYPFRGEGVGLMPTLGEVFDAFPDGRFLINFKSRRREEGAALADMLNQILSRRAQVFGVYGGAPPTQAAIAGVEGLRGFDKASPMGCVTRYAAIGWLGVVPALCRETILAIPINIAPWLWGWPDRFQRRMQNAGSEVILLGPYDGGSFSSGIDSPELAGDLPKSFDGYVWTNRIEAIGPTFQ